MWAVGPTATGAPTLRCNFPSGCSTTTRATKVPRSRPSPACVLGATINQGGREVEALSNVERYQSSTVEVDDHSTESVGGIKTIEALGALKLLSGGSASLAAVDDLHLATGRDLNLVVGQKHNATVGGDMQERIEGLRQSVASVSQRQPASADTQDVAWIRGCKRAAVVR